MNMHSSDTPSNGRKHEDCKMNVLLKLLCQPMLRFLAPQTGAFTITGGVGDRATSTDEGSG